MPLELESQSSTDELSSFDRMLWVSGGVDNGGRGGVSATLTVITNHDTDFSTEDQENEQPSPMNWDNLNRILRDIELELQQNDFGPFNIRKRQVTKPNSKKKETKDVIKDRYSLTNDAAGGQAVSEGQTSSMMTTTEPKCDTTSTTSRPILGNNNQEVHQEKLITKDRLECNVDKNGGIADDAAGDLIIAFEEDEDKERAVNALIKRMFEELAAEMVEELRVDQKFTGEDTNDLSAAERDEVKNYDDDDDDDDDDEDSDDDDDDDREKEIIDSEERDPPESIEGDSEVLSGECNRNENEEETINHINSKTSAVNDDDLDYVSIQSKEDDPDEQRDAEESKERTRRALENTAIAAAAELERRRQEEENIQRQQAEEKKRVLAEEQQRKEQLALVTTIIHANCGNEKNAYYKVLGVLPTCSAGNIKKAYRKLALKLHPDKEKFNTPKADEAFKAVSHAYDILKDEALRNEYDRTQNRNLNIPDVSAPMPNNGPTIPIIIPPGSRITIQSKDIRFAHFNGLQGCVVSYDGSTELYTIQIDEHCTTMKSKITALFRNVIVCLRAAKANELGVFVVTLVSYYKDDRGGLYQARYNGEGGKRGSVYLRSEQFIIPNGTVVGLQCGNYGTIVDWRETIDQYTRADASYYKVQLYNDIFTRVPMKNIRL